MLTVLLVFLTLKSNLTSVSAVCFSNLLSSHYGLTKVQKNIYAPV